MILIIFGKNDLDNQQLFEAVRNGAFYDQRLIRSFSGVGAMLWGICVNSRRTIGSTASAKGGT